MQVISELDESLIEEALQLTGLKTQQALIEQAVKELIESYQTRIKTNQWKKTVFELAGAWDDFPDLNELRSDSMLEQSRESL